MAEAENESSNVHVVMFPWFASGYVSPFFNLSTKLAERGCTISFLIPNKLLPQLNPLNVHPDKITLHPLTVPHVKGLPHGAETTTDIPVNLTPLLSIALDRTRFQVERIINQTKPKFVIYDMAYWIPEITKSLGIKAINYTIVCATSVAIALVPSRKVNKRKRITEAELLEPPAGYPSSTVVLRGCEVRSLLFISEPYGERVTFYERMYIAMKESDALAIRTCHEVEGKFCDYIANQYGKPVFLSGPVLSEYPTGGLEDQWSYWLWGFEDDSVIFCAFGDHIILEMDQFQELILGLELTGLPFLVAVKPPYGASTVEEAVPEGFEERINGRGMVWGGWIEHTLILDHPSVGCYINHCAFGAMWEALLSKCQLIMVPELGDQILNTRLMVEELKVGVEVSRDETGWFSKENLCDVVKSVMDEDSQIGLMVKENHTKWRHILGSQEFMDGYIDNFLKSMHALYD